jgi:hypothetical protein
MGNATPPLARVAGLEPGKRWPLARGGSNPRTVSETGPVRGLFFSLIRKGPNHG